MATDDLSPDRFPINAEARGKLRVWKGQALLHWSSLNGRVRGNGDAEKYICDMVQRSSIDGRRRAFEKLRRLFAGAFLEGVRLQGRYPLAVWSTLKPRTAVVVETNRDDPGLFQDCVVVDYWLAGALPGTDAGLADGLWTMEVSDHALGRALQRMPGADLTAILRAAHHAALRARRSDAEPIGCSFLLPAGDGIFLCEIGTGADVSLGGEHEAHIRAKTWLDADQLYDDQRPVLIDGIVGERLGDAVLLPAPLRRFTKEGIATWAPGLPETLASPQGRA